MQNQENENESESGQNLTSHLLEWLSSKRQKISVGEAVTGKKKKKTLMHYWWECKLIQPLWKTVWSSSKKLQIELPYLLSSSNPISGSLSTSNDIGYQRYIYAVLLIAAYSQWPRRRYDLSIQRGING